MHVAKINNLAAIKLRSEGLFAFCKDFPPQWDMTALSNFFAACIIA